MNEIRALLRMAATRLELTAFAASLHVTAVVLAATALVLALADRAPGEPFVAWTWVAPALGAVAVLAAAIRWSRRRPSELQVAVAVDDRLDLKEKLSTALHVSGRDDAFAQAAVEDAVHSARDPRLREAVKRRFAVQAPRHWWISPLLVIVAGLVLIAPQANIFAYDEQPGREEVNEIRAEVRDSLEVLVKSVEDKPELSEELAGLVDELTQDKRAADALRQPEQIRRAALKKVTELNRRLDQIMNGEKGATSKAIEEMMAKLKTPADGPAKDLADAMAAGDFSKAKEALEKLIEDMAGGKMDPADEAQLAKQLEDLAQQLNQLAQNQEALEKALQQAGLNPQLANNPQALQQALDQAQNLNQQQMQQLQQMMQAQQAAKQMCQGMGQACQQMAQGKFGQGAGQMMNQLNQAEQLQQLLQQARAMANQAQGQGKGLGQGMSLNQLLMQQLQQGGAFGQRGQGAGGKAPIQRTPSGMKIVKADAPIVEGEVIASMLIDGVPVRGESKAKLRNVVVKTAEGFDEAIAEDPLPRKYHEAQKTYFGELIKQVEAMPATNGDAEGGDGDDGDEGGEGGDAEEPADAEDG
ncbi:MAG: hypothetical protein GY715_17490 [Planctomycetes bacterium]|nr:hypothetical protein [Planctomycetota bacterium]